MVNYDIEMIKTFKPNKVQIKLINFLEKQIMNSTLKENYDFSFKTQKYTLKFILTHIIFFLHNSGSWRSLGKIWNTVYKHYIKINSGGFLAQAYIQMLQTYLKKTNHKTLKFVSCDTTMIINKNGVDCRKRNKYAKNKNCTKLFTIIDKNKIPIVMSFVEGNTNDIRCLNLNLVNFLNDYGSHITHFLADTGFHSRYILDNLQKYNIYPLIPKSLRTMQKSERKNLPQCSRIKFKFDNFDDTQRKIYKSRILIENMHACLKNTNKRFNIREDRYINNLIGFAHLYFLEKMFGLI